jgi:carbamoyltransferase
MILAIHDGHNASVVLMDGQEPVFAVQEERLRKVKNYTGIPTEAIAYVVSMNVPIMNVEVSSHLLDTIDGPDQQRTLLEFFSSQDRQFGKHYARYLANKYLGWTGAGLLARERRTRERKNRIALVLKKLGLADIPIHYHDHHLCHAASAYYGLRRDGGNYLVLTLDGGGDGLCATVNIASDASGIKRLSETADSESVGNIYSRVTFAMGMVPWEHEYKLMGMAPYAEANRADRIKTIFSGYLDLDPEESLRFKRKCPEPTALIASRVLRDLRGVRFDLITAGLQAFTEEIMVKWVQKCVERTGIRRVLCAGGVFMNVKANGLLLSKGIVDSVDVFPSCGDESLPFGAAYLAAAREGERAKPLTNIYLGPKIDDGDALEAKLAGNPSISVERMQDPAARTAELLAEGEIIARATGRMEFGARALGNRSILADPSRSDVVRVINQMVKKRDFWMPFAPVVRDVDMHDYFYDLQTFGSPYMMFANASNGVRRSEMSAAIHAADRTGRPQTVTEAQNPEYYRILTHFKRLTGRAVLLNTSFNLHGLPVVCDIEDALHVMENSGLTRLVVNNLLITRNSRGAGDVSGES